MLWILLPEVESEKGFIFRKVALLPQHFLITDGREVKVRESEFKSESWVKREDAVQHSSLRYKPFVKPSFCLTFFIDLSKPDPVILLIWAFYHELLI